VVPTRVFTPELVDAAGRESRSSCSGTYITVTSGPLAGDKLTFVPAQPVTTNSDCSANGPPP
jgi:hypothetical protein